MDSLHNAETSFSTQTTGQPPSLEGSRSSTVNELRGRVLPTQETPPLSRGSIASSHKVSSQQAPDTTTMQGLGVLNGANETTLETLTSQLEQIRKMPVNSDRDKAIKNFQADLARCVTLGSLGKTQLNKQLKAIKESAPPPLESSRVRSNSKAQEIRSALSTASATPSSSPAGSRKITGLTGLLRSRASSRAEPSAKPISEKDTTSAVESFKKKGKKNERCNLVQVEKSFKALVDKFNKVAELRGSLNSKQQELKLQKQLLNGLTSTDPRYKDSTQRVRELEAACQTLNTQIAKLKEDACSISLGLTHATRADSSVAKSIEEFNPALTQFRREVVTAEAEQKYELLYSEAFPEVAPNVSPEEAAKIDQSFNSVVNEYLLGMQQPINAQYAARNSSKIETMQKAKIMLVQGDIEKIKELQQLLKKETDPTKKIEMQIELIRLKDRLENDQLLNSANFLADYKGTVSEMIGSIQFDITVDDANQISSFLNNLKDLKRNIELAKDNELSNIQNAVSSGIAVERSESNLNSISSDYLTANAPTLLTDSKTGLSVTRPLRAQLGILRVDDSYKKEALPLLREFRGTPPLTVTIPNSQTELEMMDTIEWEIKKAEEKLEPGQSLSPELQAQKTQLEAQKNGLKVAKTINFFLQNVEKNPEWLKKGTDAEQSEKAQDIAELKQIQINLKLNSPHIVAYLAK